MSCTNCGGLFSSKQQRFCSNCGLPRDFDTQVIPTDVSSQNGVKCPYCAEQIMANTRVCRSCGRWILKLPNEAGEPVVTSESPVRLVLKLTTIFNKQVEQRVETSGMWVFKKELVFDDHKWHETASYEVTCEINHIVTGQTIKHKIYSGFMHLLSVPLTVYTQVESSGKKKISRDAYSVVIDDRIIIYTKLLDMAKSLYLYGWDTTKLLYLATDYLHEGVDIDRQRLDDFYKPWDIIIYREGYKQEKYDQLENPNSKYVYVNTYEPPYVASSGEHVSRILVHDFINRYQSIGI